MTSESSPMTQEPVTPEHGDHPNDQYTYEGCPGCHPPLDLRRALDLPTTDAGERLHRLIDGPQYSGPAGRSYIREMGKRIADVEREARAEAEAQAVVLREAFGRDNPWERLPAEGLLTTIYDPWQCYACSAMVELEGDESPTSGEHYDDCGWLVLANLPQSARDHDARIAREAVEPWRQAVTEIVDEMDRMDRNPDHPGFLYNACDKARDLLATESTQQEDPGMYGEEIDGFNMTERNPDGSVATP